MAHAFRLSVEAASEAVIAGLPLRADQAVPTSPLTAFLTQV
jgi:thiazole synthase ThiGH ThiG subunit